MSFKKSLVQKLQAREALQRMSFNVEEGIAAGDFGVSPGNNPLTTPVSSFLEHFFLSQERFNREENIKATPSKDHSVSCSNFIK